MVVVKVNVRKRRQDLPPLCHHLDRNGLLSDGRHLRLRCSPLSPGHAIGRGRHPNVPHAAQPAISYSVSSPVSFWHPSSPGSRPVPVASPSTPRHPTCAVRLLIAGL